MNTIKLKNIAIFVAIVTVVGLLLYFLNKNGGLSLPSTIEIGSSTPTLMLLVTLHIIIAFAILYILFQPKGAGETAAVAGASLLWGIY